MELSPTLLWRNAVELYKPLDLAKLSSTDPLVNIFRADAKAAGFRGKAADDHVAVMLSKHAARNSGA